MLKFWLISARISNLPTVWTNVLAAAGLAQAGALLVPGLELNGAGAEAGSLIGVVMLLAMLSLSLMYIGGMFLNDAVDYHWDQQHGKERPVACGLLSRRYVAAAAVLCLVLSILLVVSAVLYQQQYLPADTQATLTSAHESAASVAYDNSAMTGWPAVLAVVGLAVLVVMYDFLHKHYPLFSAMLMGGCRAGVYIVTGLMLQGLSLQLLLAALTLLAYITGLTLLARAEHQQSLLLGRSVIGALLLIFSPLIIALLYGLDQPLLWPVALIFLGWVLRTVRRLLNLQRGEEIRNDEEIRNGQKAVTVGSCIGALLAAIPLIDALMLASLGMLIPALACLVVFLLIPQLHKWVSGT
ncbi:MAG: UbiA family prenyltransferase [Marinobacterium sp.]|nr:UbiA family prenyltransferase [Marinobacterium sp.]